MTVDLRERIAPVFPAGYPRARRLAPLTHSAVASVRHGREKRVAITRGDPLLFALLYLTPYLRDETSGILSLSDLHLALCDRARLWARPAVDRSAWAAHRDAGKPVSVDALILMGDGSRKRLGDVEVGDWVVTHRGRARRVTEVHVQGLQPSVRITTRRGRIVEAAVDHPFLTERGWVLAGDLVPARRNTGDRIVTVPAPDVVTGAAPPVEEFALAGYFIGDGHATRHTALRDGGTRRRANGISSVLTVADPVELAHIRKTCEALGFTLTGPQGAYDYYVGGGARKWLERVGIAGESSHTKRVPQWVFRAPSPRIAAFVASYFACDGTVGKGGMGTEFYSVNRDLLSDVQHLLHRLGVRSSVQVKNGRLNGEVHRSWRLRVENVGNFARAILPHLHSVKAERLAGALDVRGRFGDADHVVALERIDPVECRCLTVEEDHTFTANDLVVHNTVWLFLVLPLWALAHGHRTFYLALSYTGDQAKAHLATLRRAIDAGGLLLHDFPHLAPRRGVGYRNTQHWVTSGGVTFSAAGLGETILGRRDNEKRPNLIVGDDLDPGEEDFTPAGKAKSLGRLVNDILPMGSRRAAVALAGTPTSAGSLMHDVVRAVRGRPGALDDRGGWVHAEGFTPYWFPALTDAGTRRERSAWETHWPTAELQAMRRASPRTFALQYMCDPDDPAAVQWWTDDPATSVFRYDARFTADWRILSIDGAVTSKRADADHTALVLLAVGPGSGANRKVCVEYAQAGSWSRVELRERAWALTERYPKTLRTWLVEVNHGGEMWEEALTPPPPGVALEPYHVHGSKRHRIESLYDEYVRGAIWHSAQHAALEGQMTAWKPSRSGHGIDDLIDATGAAVRRALYGDASRAPARRGGRTR